MFTLATEPDSRSAPRLDDAIKRATRAMLSRQAADGHWVFELEADGTIPSEYVMLGHFLGEIDEALEDRIVRYLLRIQSADGGWPLFYRGDSDISASVKAYFALKLARVDVDSQPMVRARARIRSLGGAARCNVFTRFALAIFGQVPWRAVPVMPIEIMLLPKWFFFHLDKVSYWSRTVVVPLLVLAAVRPLARNPRGVDIRELFLVPPESERGYMRPPAHASKLARVFYAADSLLRIADPFAPKALRARALAAAMRFIKPRLNGRDGLGAIFPAMANAVMALDAMGATASDPDLAAAKRALHDLVIHRGEESYCQPCVSPIWDTSLVVHALLETGDPETAKPVADANAWLLGRQVTQFAGDWAVKAPKLRSGGWAFQYWNDFYPDVDDTAVVAMAMHRESPTAYRAAMDRAAEWVLGMQSRGGGWGAFDIDNDHVELNLIPFADHGALLDPPTEDVTARCIGMLLQFGYAVTHPAVARGLRYLRDAQQADGSWYGRWGSNYVYGTWSVLNAFRAAGETARTSRAVRRGVEFLSNTQQPDGGWGEDLGTYYPELRGLCKESTASQTAWALLGLMAAGEERSEAVARGVCYLLERQNAESLWDEEWYTGVGFPRVFYLRYHGYRAFFPLQALARYRNVALRGDRLGAHGF